MKRLLKSLLRGAGYQLVRHAEYKTPKQLNPDITDREWNIYRTVTPFTMVSLERIIANIRAVDHIIATKIPGDIVECGVWRGGSAMAMALALQERFRNLWMYDTYSGMTDATDSDKDYFGSPASALLTQAKATEDQKESQMIAYASLADVKANLATVNYPINRIKFVMGPVERTIPHEIPECIALLRLDTDFYESTLHELVHLYPRLSPGGLLIIDDYGHWQGAKKAVDEYFGNAGPFLHRIDYTGRLAVKPV